jgi:glucose-6-phosphate isomerase/ribosomal protein L25 (general stress protein Ctc)
MSTEFTLHAKGREDTGKGASRRLRRLAGEVPAIVYGGKKAPAQISLAHKDVTKALENEAFYSHIISLDVDGKSEDVIIKDIQRHPAKAIVMHMDFFRVSKTTKLQTSSGVLGSTRRGCLGTASQAAPPPPLSGGRVRGEGSAGGLSAAASVTALERRRCARGAFGRHAARGLSPCVEQPLGVDAVAAHFVAVSTNLDAIEAFGIQPENVFPMNDWVGGRFSLWSAVGLSIALAVGPDHFEELLDGAHQMDSHFAEAPLAENIPVVLALLTVWYNSFLGAQSEAIIPYTQYLHRLPAYLQQGIMESNGKSVDRNGETVTYDTGNIIWGEPGTNSQHAFFQLMHQGTKCIPAHFIGFVQSLHGNTDHHDKLMANFFAQTEALMNGKTEAQVREELLQKGMQADALEKLVPFKIFSGDKPTTTLLIDKLTPQTLGALVAMYEHKIFVEGVVWNIFSYDQWGVELGKQLASVILKEFDGSEEESHDASTKQLLKRYQQAKD